MKTIVDLRAEPDTDQGADDPVTADRMPGEHRGEYSAAEGPPPGAAPRRPGGPPANPSRRLFQLVSLLAAVGIVGTILFGVLYASKGGGESSQDTAVTGSAQTFLTDFFNFNAKSVDADYAALTNMATGPFATQAKQFFDASTRAALVKAEADSRGQTQALYIQSEKAATATVYAVVDQTFVNNKVTAPQSVVERLVISLHNVSGTWKISDVTVLQGAAPTGQGSASTTRGG